MMLMSLYDDRLLLHHRCCLHHHRPLCPREDCPEAVFVEAATAVAAVVVEAMKVIREDNSDQYYFIDGTTSISGIPLHRWNRQKCQVRRIVLFPWVLDYELRGDML